MFPATIFRQLYHRPSHSISKGLTDLLKQYAGASVICVSNGGAINCLNRYAAATGFIRISLLNIDQYRNWDVARLGMYAGSKRISIHMRTLKGRNLLQDVINRKCEILIERKKLLVEDIREARTKVKQHVRNKIEQVTIRENILTIPNLLTTGRAVLSPYIGYVITQGDYSFAMSLLFVAGITDLLDGLIARRWPAQASKAGSFLDPMADKLLIGSLAISMCYCDLIPLWLSGTILFRDVFLLAAGFVIRYISLSPPRTLTRYFDATHVTAQLEPTFISKVNTVIQLATIGISLGAPIWSYLDHGALHGLWYLTGVTTVAAALSYIVRKDTYIIIKSSAMKPKW